MICRHQAGDSNCSKHPDHPDNPANRRAAQATKELKDIKRQLSTSSPDNSNYEITKVVRVGAHLVLQVLYPNCAKCAYEGNKVMVFLNVTEEQVLRWRRIDPHFRNPSEKTAPSCAPSPAARFPASAEGWADAVAYATGKVKGS